MYMYIPVRIMHVLSTFLLLVFLCLSIYVLEHFNITNIDLISKFSEGKPHPYFEAFPWRIVETDICTDDVDVLIVVHTAVQYHNKRSAIRDTYAQMKWYFKFRYRVLFVVGRLKNDVGNELLDQESYFHRDIIQQDFADDYKNMTIKNLSWFRYVRDFCGNVPYILKLDDDVLPNIFEVFKEIHTNTRVQQPMTFTCFLYGRKEAVREKSSPWYVAAEAHPGEYWEDYCSGPAYLQTADTVVPMLEQIRNHSYYSSVDDAFMTGMIRTEIGAHLNGEWTGRYNYVPERTAELVMDKKVWFGYYPSPEEMRTIWNNLTTLYDESQINYPRLPPRTSSKSPYTNSGMSTNYQSNSTSST